MVGFEKGLVARGSWGKLQQCMKKAAAGEPVTLAFLGGSITQGSLASIPENCYAYRVFKWWQETFPGCFPGGAPDLLQEMGDHLRHQFVAQVVGVQVIGRDIPVFKRAPLESGIQGTLHADRGKAVMPRHLQVHLLGAVA